MAWVHLSSKGNCNRGFLYFSQYCAVLSISLCSFRSSSKCSRKPSSTYPNCYKLHHSVYISFSVVFRPTYHASSMGTCLMLSLGSTYSNPTATYPYFAAKLSSLPCTSGSSNIILTPSSRKEGSLLIMTQFPFFTHPWIPTFSCFDKWFFIMMITSRTLQTCFHNNLTPLELHYWYEHFILWAMMDSKYIDFQTILYLLQPDPVHDISTKNDSYVMNLSSLLLLTKTLIFVIRWYFLSIFSKLFYIPSQSLIRLSIAIIEHCYT